MGTHNCTVSIVMKIYNMLVKVQVEVCTLRIKKSLKQDHRYSIMSPEDRSFSIGKMSVEPVNICPEIKLKNLDVEQSSLCFIMQLELETSQW